jgi:putative transposase
MASSAQTGHFRNRSTKRWRRLKYEEVYIRAYGSVPEARRAIGEWLAFYNDVRPHQALDYRTPREVFEGDACEHVDNTVALPTCSQAHRQKREEVMY